MTEIYTVSQMSPGIIEDVLSVGDFDTLTPDCAFKSLDSAKAYVLNRINAELADLRSDGDDPDQYPDIALDDIFFQDVQGRSRDIMAEHEESGMFFIISTLNLQD